MKTLALILTILSFNVMALDSTLTNEKVAELYEHATVPDLAPWVGIALPGRCFFKDPQERNVSSVLLTFQNAERFFIAPLAADKRAPDFFNDMSFATITKRFPQYKKLVREISFNEGEAVMHKQEGSYFYEARIREFQDYFFLRVNLSEKAVRFCYYNKV